MKKCSACGKLDPLSSHICFINGKGRAVNLKPDKNSISEKLFRRLLKEFPEYADEMKQSNVRPERIYGKENASWSWSYWPFYYLCIGSPWPMKEVMTDKNWSILRENFEISILLYQDVKNFIGATK